MVGMHFNTMDGWPSGITHIRIWDMGVTWRDIHLGIDVYDWSKLDAVVGQIESIGAKMTYVSCSSIISFQSLNVSSFSGYWCYPSMVGEVS